MSGQALSASLKTKLAKAQERVLAEQFVALCRRVGLPQPEEEYHFALPRRWRVDFCWPSHHIALECEGGVWSKGRHTRGAGFISDIEKYNTLASQGYRVFRVVPGQLCDLSTVRLIGKALGVSVPEIGALR